MLFLRIIGRLLSYFFKGLGHLFASFFRLLRRHEMALGMVVVLGLVAGGVYLLLSVLNINIVFGQPQATVQSAPLTVPSPASAPVANNAVVRNNAPNATETFMQGQVNFNVNQVWDSLAAELHTSLQGRGVDKTVLDRQLQQLKSSGVQYETYQYIGGYKTPEGGSIHFYVVRLHNSQNKTTEESFVFRVSDSGQIIGFSQS